jgi:cytoskeletal protein CcmA (bactofilin family)
MELLYGRAGRLNTKNAGFRPGQVHIEYVIARSLDFFEAFYNMTNDPTVLVDAINEAGEDIDANVRSPSRIRHIQPRDLVVGLPQFNTTVQYKIKSADGVTGEHITEKLRTDLLAALNKTGAVTRYESVILERQVISSAVPLYVPPPVFFDAFSITTFNFSATLVEVEGDANLMAGLAVAGNSTFGGQVTARAGMAVNGSVDIAGDVETSQTLSVGGFANFASGIQVSSSAEVAEDATVGGLAVVGSLISEGDTHLKANCILGSSTDNELVISSHISSQVLTFDADHSSIIGPAQCNGALSTLTKSQCEDANGACNPARPTTRHGCQAQRGEFTPCPRPPGAVKRP